MIRELQLILSLSGKFFIKKKKREGGGGCYVVPACSTAFTLAYALHTVDPDSLA